MLKYILKKIVSEKLRGKMNKNTNDLFEKKTHGKLSILFDKIIELSERSFNNFKSIFIWHIILISMLLITGSLVYFLGGTYYCIYIMCLPIIIAAFLLGPFRSIIVAVIAGLIVGPYMPYDVAKGIVQSPYMWERRIIFYIILAVIVGQLMNYIKKMHQIEKLKAYENFFTGYPNFNKWKYDYNLCKKSPDKKCCIIIFEFINFDIISRYTDFEIANQSAIKLLNKAELFFTKGKIYSITNKKFLVMLEDDCLVETCNTAKKFLLDIKKPIYNNEIPVLIDLKGGIDCFSLDVSDANFVMKNLGKALSQSHRINQELTVYSNQVANEIQYYYDILISIYHALQNDSFYLVYQPKINLENDEIQGVEALLRWNSDTYGNVPISEVIKIAEEAGFINYITKWVIKNAMIQLKNWQDNGKKIKIAINISAKDLNDYTILDYIKETINLYEIDPTYLEFELTERSLIENQEKVFGILNEIRNIGIKVSLDDYGTGYNSLMYLVKVFFKFDYVKIDKIFIDEIQNSNTRILIEGIISLAQGLGVKIIAEGVESEEQLNILKKIKCDIIQGYYYSKPLRPMELNDFIEDRKTESLEQ